MTVTCYVRVGTSAPAALALHGAIAAPLEVSGRPVELLRLRRRSAPEALALRGPLYVPLAVSGLATGAAPVPVERLRLLSDMDGKSLRYFDAMALRAVDVIVE